MIGYPSQDTAQGRRRPTLSRVCIDDVVFHTDTALFERSGIRVAFTERTGGVSVSPYESLNLAGHVGDDPLAVNSNRDRLFSVLSLSHLRDRLVTAEQVHGTEIRSVTAADAGCGAYVRSGCPPIPAVDGLVAGCADVPLLMLYADCVPIILVAEEPVRAVAVLHAGWRGAYGRIPEAGVTQLASTAGARPEVMNAYIGPHVGECCYQVGSDLASQFGSEFGTITAVDGRLDLYAAVVESLLAAGLRRESIVSLDACTFDHVEQFFSYRARQLTGRHGALAVITEVE